LQTQKGLLSKKGRGHVPEALLFAVETRMRIQHGSYLGKSRDLTKKKSKSGLSIILAGKRGRFLKVRRPSLAVSSPLGSQKKGGMRDTKTITFG